MVPEEKIEAVIEYYREIFDLDAAIVRARLTAEERETLVNDEDFLGRIKYYLISEKESIYKNLREIAQSGSKDDHVRLKALLEVGRMIYPERFVEGFNRDGGPKSLGKVDLNFVLNDSTAADVARILFESGAIKSAVENDSPA